MPEGEKFTPEDFKIEKPYEEREKENRTKIRSAETTAEAIKAIKTYDRDHFVDELEHLTKYETSIDELYAKAQRAIEAKDFEAMAGAIDGLYHVFKGEIKDERELIHQLEQAHRTIHELEGENDRLSSSSNN